MYKVYLNLVTSNTSSELNEANLENYRMNQIADIIQNELIKEGNFVVYRNKNNMTSEEIINDINSVMPNICIVLKSKEPSKNEVEVYTKVDCEISNGYAKEIYKQLSKVNFYKQLDGGVIYNDKIKEIMDINLPGVLISMGSLSNKEYVEGDINNLTNISIAIKNGIVKATKLRPC